MTHSRYTHDSTPFILADTHCPPPYVGRRACFVCGCRTRRRYRVTLVLVELATLAELPKRCGPRRWPVCWRCRRELINRPN